jgi:hypothetical protein
MKVDEFLDKEGVVDEDTREEFIYFLSEIEAVDHDAALLLDKDSDYWEQMKDDFLK